MAKSRRKTYKSRKVQVDLAELQSIVEATSERPLTEQEQKKLVDSHQLLADLILPDLQSETSAALNGEDSNQAKEDKPRKPAKKNAGRRPRSDFKGADVVRVPNTDYEVGQSCPCGKCGGKLYPYKRVSYFRHFKGQAPIQVTIYELEQLRSNGCEAVFAASLPDGVGPEPYDATAVSTIALNRYGAGLPFYRQAKQLEVMGTPISPSTQYKIVSDALTTIEPVHAYLVKLAAQGKLAYFDDTSMRILDFDRRDDDKRTGIFTTGIVSVHDAFEIALLFTGREHGGENRQALLKQRDPDLGAMIMMSDALAANMVNIDSAKELIANCLTHGRRYFVKIIESFPQDCQHVISALGKIYQNDALTKEAGYDDETRLVYHQTHSEPVMTELKAWLDDQVNAKKAEPNGALGKAIAYMRSHWTALTQFLRVAGAPLDNNVAERVLKTVVLHRKNSLFYRTASGAKTGDIYMGLIQTCQRNGVNPWDYLTEIQRNHTLAKEKPEDWVPWKFLAELKERFQKFGLTLHPDKTRLIEFGRFAASSRKWRGQGKPETFDFLGFTHICGKTRKGAFMVLRKTMKKRQRDKLRELKFELRRRLHDRVPDVGKWQNQVVRGYFQYHGIPMNLRALESFRHQLVRLWCRTLRRRSQKHRCSWNQAKRLADKYIPLPKVVHPYPTQQFGVIT